MLLRPRERPYSKCTPAPTWGLVRVQPLAERNIGGTDEREALAERFQQNAAPPGAPRADQASVGDRRAPTAHARRSSRARLEALRRRARGRRLAEQRAEARGLEQARRLAARRGRARRRSLAPPCSSRLRRAPLLAQPARSSGSAARPRRRAALRAAARRCRSTGSPGGGTRDRMSRRAGGCRAVRRARRRSRSRRDDPVADPEPEVLAVADRLHASELARRQQQRDSGVSEPERCEPAELLGELQGQGRPRHGGVDLRTDCRSPRSDARRRVPRTPRRTRRPPPAESQSPAAARWPPNRSRCSAHAARPRVEVVHGQGATRALPFAVRAGDHHDGPSVPLDQPRGDDADHALVPALVCEHVASRAPPRIRPGVDLPTASRTMRSSTERRSRLNSSSCSASRPPSPRRRRAGARAPPSGLHSRPAALIRGARRKPTAPRRRGRVDARHAHQRAKPGRRACFELLQPGDRERAVLVDERDDVGDRRERDQIEMPVERHSRRRLAQLEDDPGTAELGERVLRGPRGHDRAIGKRPRRGGGGP